MIYDRFLMTLTIRKINISFLFYVYFIIGEILIVFQYVIYNFLLLLNFFKSNIFACQFSSCFLKEERKRK